MIEIIKTEQELEDATNGLRDECPFCHNWIYESEVPVIKISSLTNVICIHRECAVAAAAQIVNLFEQL